jgi:hypothetical protein
MNFIDYLETRVEAINLLIEFHSNDSYLISERSICLVQIEQLKKREQESRMPAYGSPDVPE